jgi:hypothetical protein
VYLCPRSRAIAARTPGSSGSRSAELRRVTLQVLNGRLDGQVATLGQRIEEGALALGGGLFGETPGGGAWCACADRWAARLSITNSSVLARRAGRPPCFSFFARRAKNEKQIQREVPLQACLEYVRCASISTSNDALLDKFNEFLWDTVGVERL